MRLSEALQEMKFRQQVEDEASAIHRLSNASQPVKLEFTPPPKGIQTAVVDTAHDGFSEDRAQEI